MSFKKSLFVGLYILNGLSFGCRKQNTTELNLVNGALANDKFPSVIQSAVTLSSNGNQMRISYCTASVIATNAILTAAHCLDGGKSEASAVINGKKVDYGQPILFPGYTDNGGGKDVAVVVFPKESFSGMQIMKVAQSPDDVPNMGLNVTIVGFGKTDQFNESSGGEKRYGTNVLTSVDDRSLDFEGQTTSTTADGTNVFNSQGDSGGPMMAAEGAAAGMIIGVSSTQNQVKQGDKTGTGHYTNLLSPNVIEFLRPYAKDGSVSYVPSESDFRNGENRPDNLPIAMTEKIKIMALDPVVQADARRVKTIAKMVLRTLACAIQPKF